ncbi:MAG: YihY/virulence factor BrkB family protein [Actinomycetota bacterium]|nr:YihY/virulence factor BrkB family protein [Actinomycetota bacterium]
MRHVWAVTKRTGLAFYDDQMTHHAAAITYYCLMSLFPAALLSVSLLGVIGQFPETYDAIIGYLRDVVPATAIDSVDASLREALKNRSTATAAVIVSVVLALYGTTGALEATRRALNVTYEIEHGRSFLKRKANDVALTFVLLGLVLMSFLAIFLGGDFAEDIFGFIGLGSTGADVWSVVRWPLAVCAGMLIFSLIYFFVPDVEHRAFRWITPGAASGVVAWLGISLLFSLYVSRVADVGAIYGAFAGAIILVAWLWLTNVALLFGAELNAEIERERELTEGVPPAETLNLPAKTS